MDNIKNKKIKITRVTAGNRVSDLSILKKDNTSVGKRNYSTSSNNQWLVSNPSAEELVALTTSLSVTKTKAKAKPITIAPIPANLHCSDINNRASFAALDIETVKGKDGNQTSVAISLVFKDNESKNLVKKLFTHVEEKKLFKEFLDFINSEEFIKNNISIIFAHNLGNFDGLFLLRGILTYVKDITEISSLIDHHNKFILIKYKNIVFKDSYRIFNVSLNDLCNNFGVQGKISNYNKDFNSLDLFYNDELFKLFKEYSINDSVCLFNALFTAQEHYIKNYQVDITTIYSTSTLSLKIFRQHHLKEPIPILKKSQDAFIRDSYYGGATDYYIKYAEKLYYSDVNSLYPYAMSNATHPMPVNIKEKHYFFKPNFNLDNFFGFLEVEVTCPKNLVIPLLPFKYQGKTIFPTGKWVGTYFSEELKAVLKYGYSFKFISGIEYEKTHNLFDSYVKHFYKIKKEAKGATRFVAKMHLNQLYGYFGRSLETLETININNSEITHYLCNYVVKNILEVNKDISILLVSRGFDYDVDACIDDAFESIGVVPSTTSPPVLGNVAIASAVTSYARIIMMPVKNEFCCYTDTDSVITTVPLPLQLMGDDLGLFKDELNGGIISKGVFLGTTYV